VRMECRVDPIRKGDNLRLARFDGFFVRPDVQVVPITTAVFDRATQVRATHGYKTIDSINLAAAVEASCSLFLTNDTPLSGFPDITVEILRLFSQVATRFRPVVAQTRLLARQYDCVVANPPYMGTKFYAPNLKAFIRHEYKRRQGDLYTCFMIRNLDLARSGGLIGMITIPNWMFLSSFDELRDDILGRGTIDTFIHNGRGVFGSDFGSCSFVVRHHCNDLFSGSYRRLFEKQGNVAANEELEQRFFTAATYIARQSDFRSIPGQPIAAWPKEHLVENLTLFIADSLGPNRNEQPRDTIRRDLATGFYKHHLSLYKRRPIHWLFSSGKQRAFQCLVYLHRYHEGTLSRMRTEYVIPLQGKMASRLDQLADDIAAASSTSHRKKLEKERDTLRKQHTELQAFDEQLRHYADQRISLDLDDGVKVNYGKFGSLLAEVQAVTGGTEET